MNARAVYEAATSVLPEAIHKILDKEHISLAQVKWIIPHQPSIRVLKKMAQSLEINFEKVKTNMELYANTSAGTIPILLNEVHRRGELEHNDIVVFAAVGAGWTWGSAVYRWH